MGKLEGRVQSAAATLRLDPGLKDALERLAAEEDRSVAQVIRVLLREALKAREGKRGGAAGSRRKGKPS